jgi:hypothetical protein
MFTIADKAMYLLGPVLITVAILIISGLTYLYVSILLPMLAGTNWIYTTADANSYWKRSYTTTDGAVALPIQDDDNNMPISFLSSTLIALSTPSGILHTAIVTFFLTNIIYNYYHCVTTSNTGSKYNVIVREMACVTGSGFRYPETEEDVLQYKRNYERRMYDIMMKQQQQQQQQQQQHQPQQQSNSQMMRATVAAEGDEEAQNNQSIPLLMSTSSTSHASPLLSTSTSMSTSTLLSATTTTTTTTTTTLPPTPTQQELPVWQLLSPHEWGYCRYSHQPKPPRSHYDHATKSLILNMDHYCPWMFNVVGYFNYRYFFNFLTFVTCALWYGAGVCYSSFGYIGSMEYKKQIRTSATTNASSSGSSSRQFVKHLQSNSYIPTPNERTPITLGFMLCLCLGLAVFCLFIFHLYLILSAQSTIEFHGNWSKRRRSSKKLSTTGVVVGWTNPYSTGSYKKNWDMIYGSITATASSNRSNKGSCCCHYCYYCWNVFIAMMPSNREPEYLPFPINRELIRRQQVKDNNNMTLLLADSGDGNSSNSNDNDGVSDTDLELATSS